ncbi:MAG: hypothetical protein MSG64_05875 [Pyrinomonadaceae bacterium MAG19_C2-C3]|nr:hypothetical protein [Pyrinomonadaceae bacterium MAG19_C2-C3]
MSNDRTAEILRYLSAMSHDIGDFRAEMNKRIDETNKRIDDLRLETNTRIDELRAEMNTRFDKAEREQRLVVQKLLRIESITVANRADVEELQDRAIALEEKAGIEFRRRF